MKIHQENLRQFWRFIAERHSVYRRKTLEKLPPPWTSDPILREYKFTNVFRDLDPGTRYVIEKLIPCYSPPLRGGVRGGYIAPTPLDPPSGRGDLASLSNLLFNLIIYRLYNKPRTSNAVGWQVVGKYDGRIFEKMLRELKATGEKVFTNAYLVSGYEQYASYGDKIARTSKLLEDIAERIPGVIAVILSGGKSSLSFRPERSVVEESLEDGGLYNKGSLDFARDDKRDILRASQNTYEAIRSLPGLGEFLAYQIAVDLGYARPDIYDESVHVVAGPGCKRGIDRLFLERGDLSYEEAIAWLVDHQEDGFTSVGVDPDVLFSDRKNPRLNLMAVENCLCEISKYLKVKYGEGRPRNRYQGGMKD